MLKNLSRLHCMLKNIDVQHSVQTSNMQQNRLIFNFMSHVLVLHEHSILFQLELIFQRIYQYVQFGAYLISSVHACFIEQKLVFRSNMQVLGSTCGSLGSNQYQHVNEFQGKKFAHRVILGNCPIANVLRTTLHIMEITL